MNEMSVQELRQSLREKGLKASGSRKQLMKRLTEAYEATPSDGAESVIKYRITILCHKRNEATMLMLAPATGHKLLSQILARCTNKFRIRARRAFLSSGLELTSENIEPFIKDGVKVVVTNGANYELGSTNVNGSGSPVIDPEQSPSSPPIEALSVYSHDEDENANDDSRYNTASQRRISSNNINDSDSVLSFSTNTDLKVDELDIASESGVNVTDSASVDNDSLTNLHAHSQSRSLLSMASSIPAWLIDHGKSLTLPSSSSQSSLNNQLTTPNKPSSRSSPVSVDDSPSPSSSMLSPPALSYPSLLSLSSSPALSDDDATRQLRDTVRYYEDAKRALRRAETKIVKLEREIVEHTATQSRVFALESALKESQAKYADSEARLLLASKATEKAVRERDTIKLKHKSVIDQLNKAQDVRVELESSQKSHRALQQQFEALHGKNMEEKNLTELQTLLAFHQHQITRLMSVMSARIDAEKKMVSEQWTCRVCMEKPISVMLQPCHHAVTCGRCSAAVTLCPICRRTIGHRDPFYAP